MQIRTFFQKYAVMCSSFMARHSIISDYSGAVVKASDWYTRDPGFSTLQCDLYDIIVLFLMLKSVEICFIYICFSILILKTDEWSMFAVVGL